MKRKALKSLLIVVGAMFSPLSFLNDGITNLPVATGIVWLGTMLKLIPKDMFPVALIAAYWATNILGILMLQIGISMDRGGKKALVNKKKRILINLAISIVTTALLLIFIHLGVITAPQQ